MGKHSSVVIPVLVGLLGGAYFFVQAVHQKHQPLSASASGFALPGLLPTEEIMLSHTGTGTIQGEVRDETTFKARLLSHYIKGFALTRHLRRVSEDPDIQGIADSMMRRYLRYILQAQEATPSLDNLPLPLDVTNLSMEVLHQEFLTYMIRHHYWSASLIRQALSLPLSQNTATQARQLLFVEHAEIAILEALAKR